MDAMSKGKQEEWVVIALDAKMTRRQGMPAQLPIPKSEFEPETIKAKIAHGDDGWNATRDGKIIAEIPLVIAEQWMKEGVEWWNKDHDAEIRKRINDPALAAFRYDSHSGNTPNIIVKGKR